MPKPCRFDRPQGAADAIRSTNITDNVRTDPAQFDAKATTR
jgi:hypothetical protein